METIWITLKGVILASWDVLLDASPFILLGFLFAAIIHAFIRQETIIKHLGKSNLGAVFKAALFGVPIPLCSCGVVPTAMALKKQGASKAATLSFLITTPESSIDSIAITYALIDPLMTIARPVAAFATGFLAGAAELVFGKSEPVAKPEEVVCMHCRGGVEHEKHNHSLKSRLSSGFRFAFLDLFRDISRWFLIGIVIAGIINYAVPTSFIENYLGRGWLSMFVMLAVGIPLYICATASTPIAASLIMKGMNPGAALVFLLAGPATNAASLVVITKLLGKRSAVIYLISIAISSILLGALLNFIYGWFNIDIRATMGHAHEMLPLWLKWCFAVPMLLTMLVAAVKGPMHDEEEEDEDGHAHCH